MARRRLIWKVAPGYLLVVMLCTAAAAWFSGESVRQLYFDRAEQDLRSKAALVVLNLRPLLEQDAEPDSIQALVRQMGNAASLRLTVIAPDGLVLGDSNQDPAVMENHSRRPEVIDARAGGRGMAIRRSPTLNDEMLYVALPMMTDDGRLLAIVRTAFSLTRMRQTLRDLYVRLLITGLLTALAGGGLILVVFNHQINRPLKELEAGAQRYATGMLDRPLPVGNSREIGGLAEALSGMAHQLDEKIRTVTRQAGEREAVLSSMIEGVLAVDGQERLIAMNAAAARLTGVTFDAVQGRSIYETIRNADLQAFISRALRSEEPLEGEFTISAGDSERYLQATGALLRGTQGHGHGAVVVLNDVTRLRQLETIRQQFVANVSHELKTPITAIKAAVETLLNEPLSGPMPEAQRFLGMILRQADRLNAIVDDLLTLARLEQSQQREQIEMRIERVLPVVRAAAETCQAKASAKSIDLSVVSPEDLQARCNAALLEQAVVNLLDNAIKYSPPGTAVQVQAQRMDSHVAISVSDQGPGVETEHLSRIFERFYRTDRARSREMGGTGLGLSIVKHVAQAHGGKVEVDSTPGRGSTFRIVLPGS